MKTRFKKLLIAHIANPVAGVGVYLELLNKYSDKEKFEHIVLCNSKLRNESTDLQNYCDIPLEREIQIINDIRCFKKIIVILKDLRPDIIHCHSAKAGILGRIAGAYLKIPTYYTPHAYSYLSSKSIFKRTIFKRIEKMFRLLPSRTIACSKSEFNRTINDLGFKKNKVFLWENSINIEIDICKSNEEKTELPKGFLCSIGRPSYQKDTLLLVETIYEIKKTIKKIHLVILGVGLYSPLLNKIKEYVNKNDLSTNITFVNWLEREKMLSILKDSKLYISTSRYEGLPYAVLEALALSKPCVVTDVDGNKDLIRNNYNGFLVKPDSRTISAKVIQLLQNEEKLSEMGRNSKKVVEENHNIKKTIRQLESIYFG